MAQASPAYFGQNSLFIPEFTGRIVGYVRDQKQFQVWKYVEPVRSTNEDKEGKPIATYFTLDPDEPVRIPSGADWKWAPGTKSPEPKIIINGSFTTVIMDRDAFPYEYSGQAKMASDVPIGALYRQFSASIAMTNKTNRIVKLLETPSNYPASNVQDANTLNGGKGRWKNASADEMSPNFNAIKRSLSKAMQTINLKTNAVVKPSMLNLVISPPLASDMANSGEITAYLKSSPFAFEVQEGLNDFDELWNLPKMYHGLKIVVEDAPEVTVRRNAAGTPTNTARQYIKSDNVANITTKMGKIDGVEGSPTMSTVQAWYWRYEMTVMEQQVEWDDLIQGKVIDQYKEVLVAPTSGFLITNV